jgi:uncharacterized protein (DUF2336 family)
MIGFIKKYYQSLFGYETQRTQAVQGSAAQRAKLAAGKRTQGEILYYLAEKDQDPAVRAAAARNPMTPFQAARILAADKNVDVRLALAERLVKMLPDISRDQHSQLYAYAVQTLGTLALDEVLKVRKALSSALKDHAHTPPKIAGQLARDMEREVAEPILRFCAALPDDDLLDILKQHPAGWAVDAIAGRPHVSGPVSRAVIDTDHAPGGKILLENKGAQIETDLLRDIIQKAREYPEWHEPLAVRKNLPPDMARHLAEFVDDKVRHILASRRDIDKSTVFEITQIVRRRVNFETQKGSVADKIVQMVKDGTLNESAVNDALAMRDKDFIVAALAVMVRTSEGNIRRVFDMRAARPICALCHRAGLSMRLCLALQQGVGQVPPKELLYPKGGVDYPLTDDDIKWQLDFLGL